MIYFAVFVPVTHLVGNRQDSRGNFTAVAGIDGLQHFENVIARDAKHAIAQARSPFNPSPIVQPLWQVHAEQAGDFSHRPALEPQWMGR